MEREKSEMPEVIVTGAVIGLLVGAYAVVYFVGFNLIPWW